MEYPDAEAEARCQPCRQPYQGSKPELRPVLLPW